MLDLIAKNKEMLETKQYDINDTRQMLKLSSLPKLNDYDLYLIACCLCNYSITEKFDARMLRTEYYEKTNGGDPNG